MPGRNGKGPLGEGPMTGRGMGRCVNNGANRMFFRRGCGNGFGFSRAKESTYENSESIKMIEDLRKKIEELEEIIKKNKE
ncbi:MAG: DUF5320 domain-containing protein [Candidatus Delongbacteria bacterium]|nr:DUF5320 domain-containing protein [Candidatus Delongbacteria bacterium]MBN2835106.1 DUF5320 domain-containing protein [Candidatus Delongbacteria bacterium]